ncbi:hypothetical protein [Bacillus nitroreducens]
MKYRVQYIMGYIGYFLLAFMALRAVIIQDDILGFIILTVGLLFLMNYLALLEKQHGTPKYSGYIKLILALALLISGFTML